MEKTMFESRPRGVHEHQEDSFEFSARKFHVMRTLARLHECDEETILDCVEASEEQVGAVLEDLLSRNEAEVKLGPESRTKSQRSFALTLNGWGEYLSALGSMYAFPE